MGRLGVEASDADYWWPEQATSLMGFHKSFYAAAKHWNELPASFQPQLAGNLWFNSRVSSAWGLCLWVTDKDSLQQRLPVEGAVGKTLPTLCQVIQNSPSTCFEAGLLVVLNWRRKNQHVLVQQWSWGMVTCSSWAQAISKARSRWNRTIIHSPDKAEHSMSEDGREITGSLGFFGFLVTAQELSHKRSLEQANVWTKITLCCLHSKIYIKIYNCVLTSIEFHIRIQNEATKTPWTFVMVARSMMISMIKISGDAFWFCLALEKG